MPKRVRVLVDSAPLVAELRPDGIGFDDPDGTYRITPEFDGRYRIEGPFGSVGAVAAIAGDRIWIGIEGDVIECRIGIAARHADDGQAALASPMPATVTTLTVAVGDAVREGDVLLTLEAMKMELPIRAPRDGVITAVHCREGELVEAAVPLVAIGDPPSPHVEDPS